MKRYIRAGHTYYDLDSRKGLVYSQKEKNFEKLLQENGFTILGVHEYGNHTMYKVEKEGIVMETRFPKGGNPKGILALLEDNWQMHRG